MRLVDAASAEDYLRTAGRIAPSECIKVRELSGGVSNVVLYVARLEPSGGDFVLKQARGQLRVAQPWYCSVERIWREADVLRICEDALASRDDLGGEMATSTPHVLWEDRENYALAMTAAPPHVVWKEELLAGRTNPQIAAACGRLLGRLHAATWRDSRLSVDLGDRTYFHDLRVDPYYRRVAELHPALRPQLDQLIRSVQEESVALVHGDFSPKNLLVYDGGLMLVDCEVGHFGDPAFDLGFFLSHLSLKAIRAAPYHEPYLALIRSFWNSYQAALSGTNDLADLARRAMANLAGCVLARVDGKSPVDYLNTQRQEAARQLGYRLFQEPFASWEEAALVLHDVCQSLTDVSHRESSRP